MKRVMMKMRETRPVRAVPQIRLMKVLKKSEYNFLKFFL